MAISADVFYLTGEHLAEDCLAVREAMRERFGREEVDKKIPPYDWSRWSIVLEWIRGTESLLDIGTAHGTFLNSAARSKAAGRIVGIDIREPFSLFAHIFPGWERIIVDAEEMPFADNEFETVTCMEVVEHLPDGKMENVIAQLRRVAAKRLIVSVPFCEPIPLSKYHSQQFVPERVQAMFPTAKYTLLLKSPVTRVPWLIIDEAQD